jgi:hypothetical protein
MNVTFKIRINKLKTRKMKNYKLNVALMVATLGIFISCNNDSEIVDDGSENRQENASKHSGLDRLLMLKEAKLLLTSIALDGGKPYNVKNPALKFTKDQNVFVPSVLGIDYRTDISKAAAGPTVRMPMFKGWETINNGRRLAGYVVTETSDKEMSQILGVAFAPRMADSSPAGIQKAVWSFAEGKPRLVFEGSVDFSPKRSLVAGPTADGLTGFPPAKANPGAVASDNWSSYVRLPSGVVINAQLVANSTGIHDRIPDAIGARGISVQDDLNNPNLSYAKASVVLQLLDGWHAGKQFYYHLVTDTSDPAPAAIEKGVFAPRLAKIPSFGVFPGGALLGFAPSANGNRTRNSLGQIQGLNNTILSVDQDQDPTNTFPIDPSDPRFSPMWDAHINEFTTPESSRAIIKSIPALASFVRSGVVIPFRGNLAGPINPSIAGLTPTGAIINCPVITQPSTSVIGTQIGEPRN